MVGDTGDEVHLLDERLDMLGTDNDDEVFSVDEVMGFLSDDEVARLVRVHRYRDLHAPCGHAVSVAPVLLALAASRSWIGREQGTSLTSLTDLARRCASLHRPRHAPLRHHG